MTKVKICGMCTAIDVEESVQAGADYLGFVFFDKSPRNISLPIAAGLCRDVPSYVRRVALTVNPDDDLIASIIQYVPIDMIQLQGQETPERVAEIRRRSLRPVMKAIGIAGRDDLEKVAAYSGVSDQILLDAKPPSNSRLPGGNGVAFDWGLLENFRCDAPWMLAGGLNADNVATAIRQTKAPAVDVSSGVESAPGEKDPVRIAQFVEAVRQAEATV